jgi:hypothetical protein
MTYYYWATIHRWSLAAWGGPDSLSLVCSIWVTLESPAAFRFGSNYSLTKETTNRCSSFQTLRTPAEPFHLRYCIVEVNAFLMESSCRSSYLVRTLLDHLQPKIASNLSCTHMTASPCTLLSFWWHLLRWQPPKLPQLSQIYFYVSCLSYESLLQCL